MLLTRGKRERIVYTISVPIINDLSAPKGAKGGRGVASSSQEFCSFEFATVPCPKEKLRNLIFFFLSKAGQKIGLETQFKTGQ